MIKLFTHTDLDGIGCAILAKLAFGNKIEVDIEYCDYSNVNEKVKAFVTSELAEDYKLILITDISVNLEVAELIEENIDPEKIQLLDHHKTAEYLNVFDWAHVNEYLEDGMKNSGTTALFYYLLDNDHLFEKHFFNIDGVVNSNYGMFVEIVRKYDSWEWKTKYNDLMPKLWNDLFNIIGRDNFIESIITRLNEGKMIEFNDTEKMLLNIEQEKINKYIESKQKALIEKDILGYKAGIVFAEQYHSEAGNRLAEMNPHLDFIVLINPSYSVSYRTVKDIDLGHDVAKVYGGGGHPKAAGSPLPELFKENMINFIFQ